MTTLHGADLIATGALITLVVGIIATYIALVLRGGAASYERVERQGSSRLLSRRIMEMGYWSLQRSGRGLAQRGITPNQVSIASLLTGLGAGVALGFGMFGLGGLLTLLSGFLDILDGMVARATGTASDAGEVVDATIDRYTEYAFFGGLIIYYRFAPLLQILVLLALVGSSMVTYSTAKSEALSVKLTSAMMRRHERTTYLAAGSMVSGLSVIWERHLGLEPALGAPLLLALLVVAVLANLAALRRMRSIATTLTERARPAA